MGQLSLRSGSPPALHPGRAAEVFVGEDLIGVVGELHPRVAAAFGIDGTVAVGELALSALLAHQPPFLVRNVSSFPPVLFDLAFDLAGDVAAAAVTSTLRDAVPELTESVELFDVFAGPPLAEGRKSLAFHVMLRAADRTLTDEEVAPMRDRMAEAVETAHGGVLRSA